MQGCIQHVEVYTKHRPYYGDRARAHTGVYLQSSTKSAAHMRAKMRRIDQKRASGAFADRSRSLRTRGARPLVEEPSRRGAREKRSRRPADAVDGPVKDQT